MTNADRIRQMSDEELADFLMEVHWAIFPPKIGWLDWLKHEDIGYGKGFRDSYAEALDKEVESDAE